MLSKSTPKYRTSTAQSPRTRSYFPENVLDHLTSKVSKSATYGWEMENGGWWLWWLVKWKVEVEVEVESGEWIGAQRTKYEVFGRVEMEEEMEVEVEA